MLRVATLQDFETPIFDETATAGIIQGTILYCDKQNLNDESQQFSLYIRELPQVNVTQDMLATRESARAVGSANLFLPIQDSMFKKIVSIWRERGLAEAIRTLACERPENISYPLHWLAWRLTKVYELFEKGFRNDGLPSSGAGSIADVVSTRDWSTAHIRCMAWHPHCPRLAVATRDNRIRVYSNIATGVPVLRHNAQKSVCCLSWRPYSGRELAAACQTGVLVWTVELGAASNSLSHAVFLQHKNHGPVTSVAWSPQGEFLVSCCLSDLSLMIWDVAMETGVPLRRVGGGGLCIAKWSACGSRLLSTSCSTVFRVWNTETAKPWNAERWTVPSGRVAAACFGPNLSLIFTSTENPAIVFSLPLREHVFETKNSTVSDDLKIAVPLIDLSKVDYFVTEDEEVSVGGRVVAMDWDVSGKFLAIIFQDSPLVAIFKTKVGKTSRISDVKPGYLVRGFPGEVPNCIQFYQNQRETDVTVVLTIAWSSGRLQHLPIVAEIESPDTLCKTTFLNDSVISSPRNLRSDMHSTVFE